MTSANSLSFDGWTCETLHRDYAQCLREDAVLFDRCGRTAAGCQQQQTEPRPLRRFSAQRVCARVVDDGRAAHSKTDHQRLRVIENAKFGRVLTLDGVVQTVRRAFLCLRQIDTISV